MRLLETGVALGVPGAVGGCVSEEPPPGGAAEGGRLHHPPGAIGGRRGRVAAGSGQDAVLQNAAVGLSNESAGEAGPGRRRVGLDVVDPQQQRVGDERGHRATVGGRAMPLAPDAPISGEPGSIPRYSAMRTSG